MCFLGAFVAFMLEPTNDSKQPAADPKAVSPATPEGAEKADAPPAAGESPAGDAPDGDPL